MNKVRILFVEDSPEDLILFVRLFKKSGIDFAYEQVDSWPALTAALLQEWDIVISDFHLNRFTASEVVKLVMKEKADLPVIVVSGAISEEDAVDLMRTGAKDFIRKDNHVRLVPAILRELRESEQRFAKRQAESALATSLELNERILESMEDAVMVLDDHRKLASLNSYGVRGFQLPENQWQGCDFADLWPQSEDRANAIAAVEKAQSGAMGKFVSWHPGQQGQDRWWHNVVTPLSNSQKISERLLVISRDITEDRRIQEELEKALVQAESANRMKTAFLANMSHEIRTPVGAMMGFSELFLDSSTTEEERQEYTQIIKRNGETLLKLLNEILDLSKIEAGHLEIETMEFSPREVVTDVMNSLKLLALQKNLVFQFEFAPDIPAIIKSDPTRLKQILLNLVGNAIKFTETGFVKVFVSVDCQPSKETLCFLIKDSGIGIQADDHEHLFQVFSQGDNSLTRRFGGAGLGLVLSKRLALALGGNVSIVSSKPGEGSVFLAAIATHSLNKTVRLNHSVSL